MEMVNKPATDEVAKICLNFAKACSEVWSYEDEHGDKDDNAHDPRWVNLIRCGSRAMRAVAAAGLTCEEALDIVIAHYGEGDKAYA